MGFIMQTHGTKVGYHCNYDQEVMMKDNKIVLVDAWIPAQTRVAGVFALLQDRKVKNGKIRDRAGFPVFRKSRHCRIC